MIAVRIIFNTALGMRKYVSGPYHKFTRHGQTKNFNIAKYTYPSSNKVVTVLITDFHCSEPERLGVTKIQIGPDQWTG